MRAGRGRGKAPAHNHHVPPPCAPRGTHPRARYRRWLAGRVAAGIPGPGQGAGGPADLTGPLPGKESPALTPSAARGGTSSPDMAGIPLEFAPLPLRHAVRIFEDPAEVRGIG